MNTVDLRRTGRKGAACAAVAAFAMLGAHHASAEVANPNLVPSNSAYIFSIPDASAFWSAWESNGLYKAYQDVMEMPEIKSKISGFGTQISIVENSLGFKLDGATLSKVFSSADVYMLVPEEAGKTNAVALMKIADEEKLTKLMDLAEKAAAQSQSSDSGTSETADADKSTSAIKETDYNGVTIKSFSQEDSSTTFIYARAGGFLVFGSDMDSLKKALDHIKTAPENGTVATSDEFKKINSALASEKGELYMYGNQQTTMKMQAKSPMSSQFAAPLKALMDDMAPMTYYGASINIEPKEIASYTYGLLKENTSDSLLLQHPGDKPLKVVSYVPDTTIAAGATSLFNAQLFYNMASSIAEGSGANLDEKLKGAESGMGFSVKNDLVPAIGNEIALAINEIKFDGMLPTVDATIVFSVKDKSKMQKVVGGVERLATNIMAAKSDASTSASQFQTDEVAGQTIHSVQTQSLAGFSPGYVLTDDYLFIGTTKKALKNALEANSNGKNLPNSSAFKGLGHSISANANTLQFINFTRLWDVADQVTNAIPAAKPAGKYVDALKVLDVTGSANRVENGAITAHGVLKLK